MLFSDLYPSRLNPDDEETDLTALREQRADFSSVKGKPTFPIERRGKSTKKTNQL